MELLRGHAIAAFDQRRDFNQRTPARSEYGQLETQAVYQTWGILFGIATQPRFLKLVFLPASTQFLNQKSAIQPFTAPAISPQ